MLTVLHTTGLQVTAAATPTPAPGTPPDPELVTPGTIGFLATLAVVVATVFIIRDAVKRVRRVRAQDHAVDVYPIPIRTDTTPSTARPGTPYAEPGEDSTTAPAADRGEDPIGDTAPGETRRED